MDVRLTSSEAWYILNSLVDVAEYLQRHNIYFGVYLPQNIFLSPEGYIKLYLYHLQPSTYSLTQITLISFITISSLLTRGMHTNISL